MKTQKHALVLKKQGITELNTKQLKSVYGGTFSNSVSGPLCDWVIDQLTKPL